MKLDALLAGVPNADVTGARDIEVAEVRDDSRQVARGDMFVAVPGV